MENFSDDIESAGQWLQSVSRDIHRVGVMLEMTALVVRPLAEYWEEQRRRQRAIKALRTKQFWIGLTYSETVRLRELTQ